MLSWSQGLTVGILLADLSSAEAADASVSRQKMVSESLMFFPFPHVH
jgi:hypothetical protein